MEEGERMSFLEGLQIALIVLKIIHKIDCNWSVVFIPMMLHYIVIIGIGVMKGIIRERIEQKETESYDCRHDD